MSTARRLHYTYEDYVRVLEMSAVKLEYCEGVIYAMAGGTTAHAALGAAATRLLGNALVSRSTAYTSGLTDPRLSLSVDELYAGITLDF